MLPHPPDPIDEQLGGDDRDWSPTIKIDGRDPLAGVLQQRSCRREWELYVETELAQALPGEGIIPIYVERHPAFEAERVDKDTANWIKDLRRRWYIHWLSSGPKGPGRFEPQEVRRNLAGLPGQIAERLRRAAGRDASPSTVPLPSVHFVGRRDEMHALLGNLIECQIGAITAVHGIPGVGTSTLAFAYAWGYGCKYRGGRFLLSAANLGDLAAGVISLAKPGVALSDLECKSPELTLAKVKAALENGPPVLLVIDNLDDPRLLSEQARDRALPSGDHIHVLVTSRLDPDELPHIRCLSLDSLEPDDALSLLQHFRPIAGSPGDDEWEAASEIVRRLDGHALAIELAAASLSLSPGVPYREFVAQLDPDAVMPRDDETDRGTAKDKVRRAEKCIAILLEPILAALSPAELRAVELAAFLPPDNVPLPWICDLLLADFPDLREPSVFREEKPSAEPGSGNLEMPAGPLEFPRRPEIGLPGITDTQSVSGPAIKPIARIIDASIGSGWSWPDWEKGPRHRPTKPRSPGSTVRCRT